MRRRLAHALIVLLLGARIGLPAVLPGASPPVTTALAFAESPAPGPSTGHEDLFNLINLVILIVVLVYLLRKPVGQFFTHRSAEIRRGLEEGRKAMEAAQSKLAAAEDKMRRLEQEIAALKDASQQEMAAERERLRQAADAESERILESARSMIETATRAAKSELKTYVARQACELAENMIQGRLNPEAQARLVSGFIEGLPSRE